MQQLGRIFGDAAAVGMVYFSVLAIAVTALLILLLIARKKKAEFGSQTAARGLISLRIGIYMIAGMLILLVLPLLIV